MHVPSSKEIDARFAALADPATHDRMLIDILTARYAALKDPRMKSLILSGQARDVSTCPKTATGDYILPLFIEGVDFCDCFWQAWIGSIARTISPWWAEMPDGTAQIFPIGTIVASWSSKLKMHPKMECIFLREFKD